MIVEFLCTALLFLTLWIILKKPSNYPPGFWGLPLIGYIPLREDFQHVLTGLHKKFGKIVCWRIGTRVIVSINDYQIGKEALSGPNYLERPDFFSAVHSLYRGENCGVIGSNGLHWISNRRITLRHLRDFGMGKSKLVSTVQLQAQNLVVELKKNEGKCSIVSQSLYISVVNVIWSMVASKQYSYDDPEIATFVQMVKDFLHQLRFTVFPYFFPWTTRYIPDFLFRKIIGQDFVDQFTIKFIDYFDTIIKDHEEALNEDDPKDYIDAYLAEMRKQDDDSGSTFSRKDLIANIHDLFLAGSETTSSMIHWAVFYLAAFPGVQRKLHQELDDVLPNRSPASLEDKERLPFVEAFLHELLRHTSMALIGGFHLATQDSKLESYMIPKGTCIFAYTGGNHFNMSYWGSPEEFKPERFLDLNGNFVPPKQGLTPFGIGKRQCLGESLAKMELFIFTVTLLQHFNISPPPGKLMDITPQENNPFFRVPKPDLDILFTAR